MNEQELEQLIVDAVRAVLGKLQPPAPKGPVVRVMIGPTPDGLEFALASLATLAERYRLEYLLTSGETSQVTRAWVEQQTGGTVTTEAEAGCPRKWARGADLVVAATCDRPTAVRVALTMPETYGSKLLYEALVRGRPVILASDGLGLEAPEATPQLRHALREPIARLEVFGARLTPAKDLAAAVSEELAPRGGAHPGNERALITAEDVEAADGELILPPHAIVTPLALDRARELGIKLRRVPH